MSSIFNMGGIFKKMPVTSITFLIGVLALCGVYGLSGFYSKDAILIAAGLDSRWLFLLLTGGAFLTAGYMGRLVWIVFFGAPKSEAASHAHESGASMLLPLIVLALLSVVGGWLQIWPEPLAQFIKQGKATLYQLEGYEAMHHTVLIWGSAAWIVGLGGSLFFYGLGANRDRLQQRAAPVYEFLQARLWFDELYGYYVAKIQQRLAVLLSFVDLFVIKGILVRGSAGVVGLFGLCARSLHVGNLHGYVYWFLAGFLLLWALAAGVL